MRAKKSAETPDFQYKHNGSLKVTLISNIVFEPYFGTLMSKVFSCDDIDVDIVPVDYVEFLSGIAKENLVNSDLVVVIPNFESFYPNICNDVMSGKITETEIDIKEFENYKRLFSVIRLKTNAKIIWFGYEDYCYEYASVIGTVPFIRGTVDRINLLLFGEMKTDVVFVDLKKLIAEVGISNAYDNRGKYRWNAPYSQVLIAKICEEIYKHNSVANGVTKKCIVLDCDNVLWGGILSEVGIENLYLGGSGLGRRFQDFQRYLLSLYYYGVILTVCSKNDLSDVLRMFREHSEMILKEEHIACFQVRVLWWFAARQEDIMRIHI